MSSTCARGGYGGAVTEGIDLRALLGEGVAVVVAAAADARLIESAGVQPPPASASTASRWRATAVAASGPPGSSTTNAVLPGRRAFCQLVALP